MEESRIHEDSNPPKNKDNEENRGNDGRNATNKKFENEPVIPKDDNPEQTKVHKENRKSVPLQKNLATSTRLSHDSNLSNANNQNQNIDHNVPNTSDFNQTKLNQDISITEVANDKNLPMSEDNNLNFQKRISYPQNVSLIEESTPQYNAIQQSGNRESTQHRKTTRTMTHDQQERTSSHLLDARTHTAATHRTKLSSMETENVPTTAMKSTDEPVDTEKANVKIIAPTLSEQTIYVRATKKLPSSGPISIKDLDDFLKKAKVDFEHYYQKKPISSLEITDFNLIKTLGIGAFGKVVLGELKKDKSLYALKIIDKVGVVKRNHVRYVSNEKRILQALNFPFVITLHYFFTDYYFLYFVMSYIPGGNFYKHLKTYQKIKEPDARFYIGQLVLALEYLHYLELVHRDMKTENVMIDAFGYLKLVDFGQCIRMQGIDKTFTFTGTPDYMAPEIIVGKGYDCSVDWWALGIITFEMCAGFRPFKNENNSKLQMLILCNQYSMPNTFSRPLRKLIENLLVLEPRKRIANNMKKATLLKKHEWFKGLDWLALLNRTLQAPFLPQLQNG